ncbi:LacI family DNA-binding transcriptional regulator [Pseudorhodoferax sp.]|uniref:LacI family DNA-binding transcriptional regulator n=1 Tax=Pseudorhodoferax sp. TaxID=1993553 RepID=UPI002DD694E7|nr:LacI family DNA-binding transcriptional regulator [Pseudorhodoferax sp.]
MPSRVTAPPPAVAPPAGAPPRTMSLADVAALAGVSPGTVSRALSRPQMLSAETRERVLEAAARLGYVANGAARALAMRRTFTVGAVVPRFGSSSFPTLIQSLEATLGEAGYTLLLAAPDHARADEPVLLRRLIERGVDAVALLGTEHAPAVFSLLAAHRLPCVMMWGEPAQADSVGFDETAAAALAVEHLAGLGHRHLAFIGGRTSDNERARRRFAGVLAAVARHGLHLAEAARIETDYGQREGYDAMQQLLQRRLPVSAVICGNDYLAMGALSALDRAGVAVPARMSVASFNDNDFAPFLHPPLTTVRIPIRAIGEAAARLLLARLRGEPVPPLQPLAVELVVRESTAAAQGL